jgi:hypothetical protein
VVSSPLFEDKKAEITKEFNEAAEKVKNDE